MQAILCSADGELSPATAERPILQKGQIRIEVKAFGLNRADLLQRRGLYPAPQGESPILGLEAAGYVSELASDVSGFQVGERVMALLGGGGYAEDVCVDAGLVLRIPDGLSFTEAAAIPEVFLTAHHNLFTLGKAQSGIKALIHAGASGVGTAGIQLIRAIGGQVFVTVGSEGKAAACEALGAIPILYKAEDFADVIRTSTQNLGVDLILDPVGAKYLSQNLSIMATDGRLILIGLMGGRDAAIDLAILLSKRVSIVGSTLRNLSLERKRQVVSLFDEQFGSLLARSKIRPIIDCVFSARDVMQAHSYMERNMNTGKIVLEW